MGLTTVGRDFIAGAITGHETTLFNSTNAHIGVGDSSAAFAAAQTDLQGTNKLRKPMDATYPQRTNNQLTFKATFGAADANWTWNEWGVFNAASDGVMLNRKVENLGTKASGSTWVLTVTLTITAA